MRFPIGRGRAALAIAMTTAFVTVMPASHARADCLEIAGDITGDGKTNVADALCLIITVLWDINGQVDPIPACLGPAADTGADLDCSGDLSVSDATLSIYLTLGLPLPGNQDTNADGCVDDCEAPPELDPPVIAITSPPTDTLFNGDSAIIDVTGTVSDESEVSVTVGEVAATIDGGGNWTATGVVLSEGNNTVTATGTDIYQNSATTSVVVRLDTEAPIITIETPPAGTALGTNQIDVAGMVNDLVEGTTIQPDDVSVTVNGIEAMVSNRAWVVPGLLLQPGENALTAVATDAANNQRTASVVVTVDPEAGQRIDIVSGNAQEAIHGDPLSEPLVISLVDSQGDPIVGRDVLFEVSRGDGLLTVPTVPPTVASSVLVPSDDDGLAAVEFALGNRAGGGNHRVRVTTPGFVGFVEFCAASLPSQPTRVTVEMGNNQVGVVGQPLAMPLSVLVTDSGGNCVDGTDVTFTVTAGDGSFGGQPQTTLTANSDGQVEAIFTLGPDVGVKNNIVEITIPGLLEEPATVVASGVAGGFADETTVSGIVLTNEDEPIPNATAIIKDTGQSAVTDDQGLFTIPNAPVGTIHLIADGTTTTLPGLWPKVEFEMHTVPGTDNDLGMPIYLPTLDESSVNLVGGEDDVTFGLEGVPGTELTVFANSVHCPGGDTQCNMMWSQVNMQRVPMPAPMGSAFMLAWTIQPPGLHFDPPARICIPNMDMPPGQQIEMFSFDHDVEAWVATGTATVTEDGSQVCADPGFGIVKAGWGGCVPPPPPKKCPSNCDDGNECTSDRCSNGSCVHTPTGGACSDDDNECTEDVCMGGSCTHNPTNEGQPCGDNTEECGEAICESGSCNFVTENKEGMECDDMEFCTIEDMCQNGTCKGEEQGVGDVEFTPIDYNISEFVNVVKNGIAVADKISPCSFGTPFQFSGSFSIGNDKECCEDEMILEADAPVIKGSVGMSIAGVNCQLIGYPPLPKQLASLFSVTLNAVLGASANVSASGQKNPCTMEEEFKLAGAVSGDLTLQVQLNVGGPNILQVYGGGKTGLSGNAECTNGDGKAFVKWNGVSIIGGYTVAGFINKSFSVELAKGQNLSDDINFSCSSPF